MSKVTELMNFSDENGNKIEYEGNAIPCSVTFRGKNNKLVVHKDAQLGNFEISFDCDSGSCHIGSHRSGIGNLKLNIRIGLESSVVIGNDVTSTGRTYISAVERASVRVGNDCMFASANEIRTDDSHAIFDVNTGSRVNPARSVEIGAHVWLGSHSVVLSGGRIREGSVIGMGSIVKGDIPNNCIAVGTPAKVTRTDIAWERPHLSLHRPHYKGDASTVKKSPYWHKTSSPYSQE